MKLSTGLFCVFIALSAAIASGQSQPARFQEVIAVDVKPGARHTWEDYTRKVKEAAAKLGLAERWNVFHVSTGENLNRYFVVKHFESWSERDEWSSVRGMLTRAFGEAEGLEIWKRGESSEEHVTSSVGELRMNLSSNMKNFESKVAPLYQVIVTEVREHANADYQMWLSLLAKAQNADENRAPSIRRVTVMGPSWTYATSIPMQRMGDRDQQRGPGTAGFYGEEAASRLNEMVGDGVVRRTWMVVHHHPDLSYSGPVASSN